MRGRNLRLPWSGNVRCLEEHWGFCNNGDWDELLGSGKGNSVVTVKKSFCMGIWMNLIYFTVAGFAV